MLDGPILGPLAASSLITMINETFAKVAADNQPGQCGSVKERGTGATWSAGGLHPQRLRLVLNEKPMEAGGQPCQESTWEEERAQRVRI